MKKYIAIGISTLVFFSGIPVLASTSVVNNAVVSARNQELEELTLEKAVEKAIKNSTELKRINASIELNEKERDNSASIYTYSTSENNLSGLLSYVQYSAAYYNDVASKEQQKLIIEASMKSAFIGILNTERELKVLKQELELDLEKLEILRVKKRLGLITEQELITEEATYNKKVEEYKTRERALENAYISLNIVLGEPKDKGYELILNPVYEEYDLNGDLDAYINIKIVSSYTVRERERSYESAKTEKAVYVPNSGMPSLANLEASINDKSNSIKDVKDSLYETLKQHYDNIINLEASYKINLIDLEVMKKALEIKEVQLEMGTVTEINIKEIKMQIKKLESEIEAQKYQHMQLVDGFNNPDIISVAGGLAN